MGKKSFISIWMWLIVECFTGSLFNNSSLTFSQPRKDILDITLYLLPNCPHALEVLPFLEKWTESENLPRLHTLAPTPYYPSPTLRVDYREYGVNYIGKNEIFSLINSS